MSDNASPMEHGPLAALAAVLPQRHRVLIVPHDYPDPDALASAAAMHLLLAKKFHVASQIVFSGNVSRAENKELLKRIRFRWHRLEELRLQRRGVPCIFVDTAPWCRNVTLPAGGRPIAVIDHHRHSAVAHAKKMCVDIRAGAGATTTIMREYLKAAGVPIPRWLAAIMAYAIASETLDLSRDSEQTDLDAYVDLASRADLKIIGRIRHAPLPRAYYGHLKEAMTNARKVDNLTWSHLQSIEQPEIVAEIADLLLRMEGVRWSFCTANMNGGLFVSLRSAARNARCSQLLRWAIGKEGSAGGHHRMAAGYMHMEDLVGLERDSRRKAFARALAMRILKQSRATEEEWNSQVEPLVTPKTAGPGRD